MKYKVEKREKSVKPKAGSLKRFKKKKVDKLVARLAKKQRDKVKFLESEGQRKQNPDLAKIKRL